MDDLANDLEAMAPVPIENNATPVEQVAPQPVPAAQADELRVGGGVPRPGRAVLETGAGGWDNKSNYVGWDFHLDANAPSPCIDAGDNTAVPSLLTDDMDGTPRLCNVPGVTDTGYPPGAPAIVDMGAYEVLPEPSTLALIAEAMVALIRRRGNRS